MTPPRFSAEPTYRTIIAVGRPTFLALGYQLRYRGRHNVPRHGGAVMAVNHTSYVDFLFAGVAARKQHRFVRFMAKKSIFGHPQAGKIMRGCKHIPVDRRAGTESYRLAVEALRSGEDVTAKTEELREIMKRLLDETIAGYPELTGDDLRFLPARLGGTAPTYEAAYSKDFSDMSRTRDEFTG